MPREERSKAVPFIERPIPTLTPGTEIKALIGFFRRVRNAYPELKFGGSISYSDATGRDYREDFVVDLNATVASAFRVTKDIEDVAEHLKEIAGTLSKISTGYSRPLVRVISEGKYQAEEEREYREAIGESEEQPTNAPID